MLQDLASSSAVGRRQTHNAGVASPVVPTLHSSISTATDNAPNPPLVPRTLRQLCSTLATDVAVEFVLSVACEINPRASRSNQLNTALAVMLHRQKSYFV